MKPTRIFFLAGILTLALGLVVLSLETAHAHESVITSIRLRRDPQRPLQDEWIKTVNGITWSPGMTLAVETGDTVTVVDAVIINPNELYTLTETWDPNELTLISYQIEPPGATGIITGIGQLSIIAGLDHPDVLTVTKYFSVQPCNWQTTTLVETLEGFPVPDPDRSVILEKTPHDLWIIAQYEPEVAAGAPVTYTMNYGNDGGYDNSVLIRNEFPAGAPFESAVPAPDRIDPGNRWAEWDVGDLPGGSDAHITVTVAISAGLVPSTSLEVRNTIHDHTDALRAEDVVTFHIRDSETPEFDLGDAPDSTNHPGLPMRAYLASGVLANFPTVFDPATGLPPGPLHLQPAAGAFLGPAVSLEFDADLPPDADGVPNLDPPADFPDIDGADDGVGVPFNLPHCATSSFTFTVTVPPSAPGIEWYVNAWLDWNRDGDWEDNLTCLVDGDSPEWAVQNLVLSSLVPGTYVFVTPTFLPYHEVPEEPLWMRITLSEQAAASPEDGRGPPSGYAYGETEDYILPGQEPPTSVWEKWINGVAWRPGISFTVETSDTVQVVDVIQVDPAEPFIFHEFWNPDQLALITYDLDPSTATNVFTTADQLTVEGLFGHAATVTVTKWFHVAPSIWEWTVLEEVLETPAVVDPYRTVFLEKTPPILWIDSIYDPEVQAGDTTTFTLQYGNFGGYENNVTIHNAFLPEALLVSAFPPPDYQTADSSFAVWEVGDLPGGGSGQITVTVAIAPGLVPSTTLDILDGIYNHLGMLQEETVIRFHIDDPPLEDTDIYIKDNPLDDGSVPTNEPWWISPDTWVRTDGDCTKTIHQNPIAGTANTICVRVRNRSAVTAQNIQLDVYYGSAALGFHWPGSWNPVGSVNISSLAAGVTMVESIVWNTPNTPGHFCLLIRADAFNDPIGFGPDTMTPAQEVPNNNNISMLNLNIVAFPEINHCSEFTSTLDDDIFVFDVVNPTNVTSTVDVMFATLDYSLDQGEFIVAPGGLWDRWTFLENLDPTGMVLVPSGFPAQIGGVEMAPFESVQVTVSITTEIGLEFTIEIRGSVDEAPLGGIHYFRDLPECLYLPLIDREDPPGDLGQDWLPWLRELDRPPPYAPGDHAWPADRP